jgi:hypothetical protein
MDMPGCEYEPPLVLNFLTILDRSGHFLGGSGENISKR